MTTIDPSPSPSPSVPRAPSKAPAARRSGSALRRLARTEVRLFLREPLALFWGVVFPLVILIVIGSATSGKPQKDLGGLRFIDAYVPVLVVFGLSILALNAVPAMLTSYRDRGYLRRLSTTPVGAGRVIAVQLVINLAVSALGMALIITVAKVAFSVPLPTQFAGFVLAVGFGATAMLALGALIAAVTPNTRVAGLVGSLLFFPMMFFAGLWGPRAQMSGTLREISDFTPLGATVGSVQESVAGHWPQLSHLGVLAAYAVVLVIAAVRLFRWDK